MFPVSTAFIDAGSQIRVRADWSLYRNRRIIPALSHIRSSLDFGSISVAIALLTVTLVTSRAWTQTLCTQDPTAGECELVLPPVCSRNPSSSTAPSDVCEVTDLSGSAGKRVQINLKAVTDRIKVGGYSVQTENYNASYLSPVVEAYAGDTAAVRFQNLLAPRQPSPTRAAAHAHNAADNPTNLHFFHGGVVTPRNARKPGDTADTAAKFGNGDNVYTYWKPGDAAFTYEVPIPSMLDARVLEGVGVIPHPSGVNWYHSHLHERSSDQVMGGLSGLLSVGDAKDNVVACKLDQGRCLDDSQATVNLKKRTDVRFALLRDISLKEVSAPPEAVTSAPKTATWAPERKDWPKGKGECGVWRAGQPKSDPDPKLRKGYCQPDENGAWLFPVNGQRFPTVTVEGGRNLLLRLGNLSSNVVYWLELYNEQDLNDKEKLVLLSVDGVVPAKPVIANPNRESVRATPVDDLVFMPASRAEIYIRNDCRRTQPRTLILRTKGLIAGNEAPTDDPPIPPGNDRWPEIQLMRIVLAPSSVWCTEEVALNAVAGANLFSAKSNAAQVITKPKGCVDDIDPSKIEHRRVTLANDGMLRNGGLMPWGILTQLMRPPNGAGSPPAPYTDFKDDPSKTVGMKRNPSDDFSPIPFEEYDLGDGKIDWSNRDDNGTDDKGLHPHVCVFVNPDDPNQKRSAQQLWVISNETADLHNFHIHQMKFRLANADELTTKFKIKLDDEPSEICANGSAPPCSAGPAYKLYDPKQPDANTRWHDTMPIPPGNKVFLIMSFVADEQIGRYVFHCHILKHEDVGLMAPIEVWKPTSVGLLE
jgi:FtsP/CotA-like multicopper oxidase with cupredoxin domain